MAAGPPLPRRHHFRGNSPCPVLVRPQSTNDVAHEPSRLCTASSVNYNKLIVDFAHSVCDTDS